MALKAQRRTPLAARALACLLACALACSGVALPAGLTAAFAETVPAAARASATDEETPGKAAVEGASEASDNKKPAATEGDSTAAPAPTPAPDKEPSTGSGNAAGGSAAAPEDTAPAGSTEDANGASSGSGDGAAGASGPSDGGAESDSAGAEVAGDGDDAASSGAGDGAAAAEGDGTASDDLGTGEDAEEVEAPGAGDAEAADDSGAAKAPAKTSGKKRAPARPALVSAEANIALAALDETRAIKSIELSYQAVLEPTDEGYDPAAKDTFTTYRPDDAQAPAPAIAKREGTMRFQAEITWDDGTVERADKAKADLTWTLQGFCDENDQPISQLIARMEKQGDEKVLRATGKGNGYAIVRCASNAYPDYAGATIKVAIANNEIEGLAPVDPDPVDPDVPAPEPPVDPAPVDPDAPTPEDVRKGVTVKTVTPLFQNDAKVWVPFTASSYAKIATLQGDTVLDALITFEDGTTQRASEQGIDCNWTLSYCTDPTGSRIRTKLVKVSASGTVYALGAGNGSAYLTATVCGIKGDSTARVGITGNAEVDPIPQTLSLRYTDVWHTIPTAYVAGSQPEIVTEGGQVKLTPLVGYDTGSVVTATYNKDKKVWNPELTFTLDGTYNMDFEPLATQIATVSANGTVTATGLGNGVVRVKCSLTGTAISTSALVYVRGNDGSTYVTDVSILDIYGKPIGDDSIDVAAVGNLVQLFVRVSYSDYTTKTTFAGNQIEGLKWYNLRTPTSKPSSGSQELYSELTQGGLFRAKAGFLRSWVYAVVEKGSFYDKDVWDRVQIFDGDETDRVGSSSSVKVRVYEETEYRKFGDDATLAAEMDITADQISAAGSYSDWFTFRSRGGGWGTLYASGISIPGLLSIMKVESGDLRFMEFSDEAGYTGDSGFYSSSIILGSRYRYSNYYMHAISSNGSYLGQQSVMPMLATATYFDYGNDPNSSGYGKMGTDGTLRLIMGMTGVEDGNARRMVRCVSNIKVVIADQPDKEEEEKEEEQPPEEEPYVRYGDGTGGGQGGGTGTGVGTGSGSGVGAGTKGGSGSSGGVATEGHDGGDGMGGGGSGGSLDPTMRIRELVDNDDTPLTLNDRDNPYRSLTLLVAVAVLVISVFGSSLKFKRQKVLGERMKVHAEA